MIVTILATLANCSPSKNNDVIQRNVRDDGILSSDVARSGGFGVILA